MYIDHSHASLSVECCYYFNIVKLCCTDTCRPISLIPSSCQTKISMCTSLRQVGELNGFFIFKLPEADQRRILHPLTGFGQMTSVTQALENDKNVNLMLRTVL